MKTLAIHGHPTRGKEVIEILEMLGGKSFLEGYSSERFGGNNPQGIYYIQTCNNLICIRHADSCELNDFIIFTLEEFLEKYPYKVGDKVLLGNQVKDIKGVGWDYKNEEVVYTLEMNINGAKTQYQVFNYNLQFYKEGTHIPPDITIDGEKLIAPNGYIIKRVTWDGNSLVVEYIKNASNLC